MIKEAIAKVVERIDLTAEEMTAAFDEIFEGQATPAQIAALITAMRMKGETIEEITACAKSMRAHALPIAAEGDLLEIVGTGGDCARTFNISTTSAFVIAAAGIPVAKHGNRSVSSKSGAADVLEALGANLMLEPEQAAEQLKGSNMVFLFAQKYHGAMRYAGPVRGQTGIRTVFNILGPLTNPAKANLQVMGVYDEKLVLPLAQVLQKLGVKRGLVVNGAGLDELSLTGINHIAEIKEDGTIDCYDLDATKFGLTACNRADIEGGFGPDNAIITEAVLSGKGTKAQRETVLLNAGAGIYVGGKAKSIAEGIMLAADVIDSGAAMRTLRKFVQLSL